MRPCFRQLTYFILALLIVAVLALVAVAQGDEGETATTHTPHFIEPGPVQEAIDMKDGSVKEIPMEILWRPVLDIYPENLTVEEFENYVKKRRIRKPFERETVTDKSRNPDALNLIIYTDGTVPAAAVAALAEVKAYIEGLFDDPITVRLNIDYDDQLPSGVLGATGVYTTSTPPTWSVTRASLIDDMDYDDFIQNYLPAGNYIPVRYNGASSTVTNENKCYFAWANYGAIGNFISGVSGVISFNPDITWDYDPSNGVSGYCFQSVAVHEIGHALGFLTRAEEWYQPNSDIFGLDIFRFQRTDGTGDYNPDTYEEFETTPRLVDYNYPSDAHNSNLFYSNGSDVEYRMCDGNPYQASHLRPGVDGVMVPYQSPGQTYYPNYMRRADLDLFDAIGWDYWESIPDADEDGIPDIEDNCVFAYNPNQEDTDSDAVGDSCDNCIFVYNPDQEDLDGDTVGDSCDNCIEDYNPDQADADGDDIGDACDWICGDADASGAVDIDDVVFLIQYIFAGGPAPVPLESGDTDCSGNVDIDDVVYEIVYIFSGGPEPCDPSGDGVPDC